MAHPTTLGASELREVVGTFADLLRSHKEVINRLNVYPVPDGDTGTNMTLTIESVAQELDALPTDADMMAVCKATPGTTVLMPWQNASTSRRQFVPGFDD